MKRATKKLITKLRARGYRVTDARIEVCDIMVRSNLPRTIQNIASKTTADEASVYRTIHILKKEALIEEILVKGGRPRYAAIAHHHHHVICTDCGHIAHLACDLEPTLPKNVPNFTNINSHDLTFYGLCGGCA